MNLAILSPVPPPVVPQGPSWGSDVVTIAFFRALLRYGSFERYLFFAADTGGSRANLRAISGIWPGAERIDLRPLLHLPDVLAQTPVQALHVAASHLHHGVAARATVPGGRFPVTCSAFQSPNVQGAMASFATDLICGNRPGDTVFAMSETMAEVLRQRFRSLKANQLAPWQGPLREPEVQAVALGIDTDHYRPLVSSNWRSRLNIPTYAFVVLSLGRLTPTDKGDWQPILRGLRDALAQEAPGHPPTYLVIAGSEYVGYRAALSQWAQEWGIADRIRLVPSPPDAEKVALLNAADCFLALPDNPQEAFGYSVLEAMACGLPVVAADWDGLRETVSDDVGLRAPTYWGPALDRLEALSPAYWFSEWSLMSLVAAQSVAVDVATAWRHVETLRQHPERRWDLGANARSRAVAEYAWPTVIARHEALWRAAAAKAQAEPDDTPAGVQWPIDFHAAFRHYPTRWLGPETRIRQVPGCQPVFDTPYETIALLLSPERLQTLYERAATPVAIAELLAEKAERPDALYYHLLWLIKQGYLAVVDDPS